MIAGRRKSKVKSRLPHSFFFGEQDMTKLNTLQDLRNGGVVSELEMATIARAIFNEHFSFSDIPGYTVTLRNFDDMSYRAQDYAIKALSEASVENILDGEPEAPAEGQEMPEEPADGEEVQLPIEELPAFDKIKEGLTDANKYAEGDESRGTAHEPDEVEPHDPFPVEDVN